MLPLSMACAVARQISRPTSAVMRSRGCGHELQCLADLLFGKTSIRDCQIDGSAFLSVPSKTVGGGVYEVGNRIESFGEAVAALEETRSNAGGGHRDDQNRDQPQRQLAASTQGLFENGRTAEGRTGGNRGRYRARFRVAFEASNRSARRQRSWYRRSRSLSSSLFRISSNWEQSGFRRSGGAAAIRMASKITAEVLRGRQSAGHLIEYGAKRE